MTIGVGINKKKFYEEGIEKLLKALDEVLDVHRQPEACMDASDALAEAGDFEQALEIAYKINSLYPHVRVKAIARIVIKMAKEI